EDNMVQAILFAHQQVVKIVDAIEELRQKAGLGPKEPAPAAPPNPLKEIFRERFYNDFRERKQTSGKHERATRVRELRDQIFKEYLPEDGEAKYTPEQVRSAFEALEEKVVRDLILEGKRIDGRSPKDLRQITCEVGVLPRTHGSAIFTRGETQSLVTT